MLEGLLIAVGGGLLMLPGFISDIFGILCLIHRRRCSAACAAASNSRRCAGAPLPTT